MSTEDISFVRFIDPELESFVTHDKGYISYIDKSSDNIYILIHYGVLEAKKLMRILKFGKIVDITNHFDSYRGRFVYCVKLELKK